MTYRFTTSIPYLLNRVGVRMGELFSRRLAAHGLTLPMYRVLAVLGQEGPQNLGELASLVSVELSTLSRLITSMRQKGLVTRTRPEENGRTVRIELTDEGQTLAAQLMAIASEFERVGTETFSDDEIAWLKSAAQRIHSNLDKLDG